MAKKTPTPTPLPEHFEPQLATLVREAPVGDAWVHEPKLDGYRVLARVSGGSIALVTRKGNDWTARMASVARALAALGLDGALLDGEVCALDAAGRSDFQLLQGALGAPAADLVYYVFDALFLGGVDLRGRSLLERKELLRAALGPAGRGTSSRVRFTEHVVGRGATVFQEACRLGMEGIISKRGDGVFRGGRGDDWLKVKCTGRQEVVIVGHTAPRGSRSHFGALLVATRDRDDLRYAGKVGTGFSERSLGDLARRLAPLRTAVAPVDTSGRAADVRNATWVEPLLVAEVEFTEVTRDGLMRHPVFRGLREDKSAAEVVREAVREVARPARAPSPRARSPRARA